MHAGSRTLFASLLFALIALAFAAAPAEAGSINYGDFAGDTVMYLDVTETANSPGDAAPLFGAPSIIGNKLDFDPAGFFATAMAGSADFTDGQLNFTLMGLEGTAITGIFFTESGDYSLLGTGGAATLINYALSISSIVVHEVDGIALATPKALSPASASGGDNLGAGTDSLSPWSLGLFYDLNAALAQAGVEFEFGATKIEIALDNALAAISELQSIAHIAKKDFMIDVTTTRVPEASSLVLVGLALLGLGRARSRR